MKTKILYLEYILNLILQTMEPLQHSFFLIDELQRMIVHHLNSMINPGGMMILMQAKVEALNGVKVDYNHIFQSFH